MPLVTATPIQIDTVNASGFPNGNAVESVAPISGFDCGPWRAPNGALYVLLYTPGSPGGLNIFKSTNNGVTWTQQGNGPTYGTGFTNSGSFNATFNSTTGILTIGYGLATNPNMLSFATYATTGDTWTLTAFPNLTDAYTGPFLAARQDGTLVCVYQQESGGGAGNTGYRICTSGTWSSFTTLGAGGVWGAYLDSNQTTHCIYDGGGSPRTFYDKLLSSTNVLSSAVTIFTENALNPAKLYRGTTFGSQVMIPVILNNGSLNTLEVYSGTPLNAPVYTGSGALQTAPWSSGQAITQARIRQFDGSAYLVANYMPSTGAIQMLLFINSGTSWSTAQVFYDAIANPPNAYTPQVITPVSLWIGSLFGLAGMLPSGGGGYTTAFFLIGSPSTPANASQIAFQGVRRLPAPRRASDRHLYDEKTFTYLLTGTLTVPAPVTGPLTLRQTINDYDFDLYQVQISYQSALTLPEVVCSILLYDQSHNQISNIPFLDVFLNGLSGSEYENGALVPPLRYKNQTQIRIDLFNLTTTVPITVNVLLVGKQRYPKGLIV